MKEEKKVSVIMPTYNEEKNIGECLNSLVDQSYCMGKVDFIIIDGLSSDKTLEVVEQYRDKLNIRILLNEKRKLY